MTYKSNVGLASRTLTRCWEGVCRCNQDFKIGHKGLRELCCWGKLSPGMDNGHKVSQALPIKSVAACDDLIFFSTTFQVFPTHFHSFSTQQCRGFTNCFGPKYSWLVNRTAPLGRQARTWAPATINNVSCVYVQARSSCWVISVAYTLFSR